MKIGVDGGGISTNQGETFGNAIFIQNFLKAVVEFDTNNTYFVYTLNNKQHFLSKKNIVFQTLKPTLAWMKFRVPLEEFVSPKNMFLAINQSIPLCVSSPVISFSHGLSFHFHKSLYRNHNRLNNQLNDYIKKSTYIVVSSNRVNNELKKIGVSASRIVTLLFGVPYDFQTKHVYKRDSYFMYVGMNHAIKNVSFIIERFLKLIEIKQFSQYQLYLCGPLQNYENISSQIKIFPGLSRKKLKEIYQKATAYVTASEYESFNFPVLEALSQECPVVGLQSAIIPEMREFVHLATSKEEFLDGMIKCIEGKTKKVSTKRLLSIFSWSKYVKSLIRLYNNK